MSNSEQKSKTSTNIQYNKLYNFYLPFYCLNIFIIYMCVCVSSQLNRKKNIAYTHVLSGSGRREFSFECVSILDIISDYSLANSVQSGYVTIAHVFFRHNSQLLLIVLPDLTLLDIVLHTLGCLLLFFFLLYSKHHPPAL